MQTIIVIIIGAFILGLASIAGLVYVASIDITQTQSVVTILSAVVTGVITATSAIVTHYVSGVQEAQRANIQKP